MKSKTLVFSIFAVSMMPGLSAVLLDSIGTTAGTSSVIQTSSAKGANFVIAAGTDYTLDSVVLAFGSIDGDEGVTVGIWSDDGTSSPIGSLLTNMTATATVANGQNTFTPDSALTLTAGTTYWVAVTNTVSGKDYNWLSYTQAATGTGASNTRNVFGSGTPGTWSSNSSLLNAVRINATAVPEPSGMALASVAGLALLRRRR